MISKNLSLEQNKLRMEALHEICSLNKTIYEKVDALFVYLYSRNYSDRDIEFCSKKINSVLQNFESIAYELKKLLLDENSSNKEISDYIDTLNSVSSIIEDNSKLKRYLGL